MAQSFQSARSCSANTLGSVPSRHINWEWVWSCARLSIWMSSMLKNVVDRLVSIEIVAPAFPCCVSSYNCHSLCDVHQTEDTQGQDRISYLSQLKSGLQRRPACRRIRIFDIRKRSVRVTPGIRDWDYRLLPRSIIVRTSRQFSVIEIVICCVKDIKILDCWDNRAQR